MSGRGLMLTYQIRVGHSVLGIPIPKSLAFWASPYDITAAFWASPGTLPGGPNP